jgi:hypothetical protein
MMLSEGTASLSRYLKSPGMSWPWRRFIWNCACQSIALCLEAVVQVQFIGPAAMNYINPADDRRKK